MILTDIDLADLALASYAEPATVETSDVHALIVERDGIQIIALRGTDPHHLIDLIRDAEAVGLRRDPILGDVSASFLGDAEQLVWRLWPSLRAPYALTGHSKGAAEAQALAAILAHMGRPPMRLAAFEPPLLWLCNGLVAALPGIATRHGDDEITEWPKHGQAQPLTLLPWIGPRPLDPLAYHYMQGVRAALAG